MAESRPSESNGIRRFSLSFGGVSRNPDLVCLPIHALILNEEHLAAPATQLQRADDPVVQHRSDVACAAVFIASAASSSRFSSSREIRRSLDCLRLLVQPHAEPVIRRLVEQGRRLRHVPNGLPH